MNRRSMKLAGVALVALAVVGVGMAVIQPQPAQTKDKNATEEKRTKPLSDEEVSTVAGYIVGVLTDPAGCTRVKFSEQELFDAIGIRVPEGEGMRIQEAVLADLGKTDEGRTALAGLSRCSDYAACSVDSDLTNASGEALELYQKEKAEDGVALTDFDLPAFEATSLSGETVRSSDLIGEPAILVFLARHCGHSVQSLAVLEQVAETYGPQGVRVVGVLVNTDSIEQAEDWFGKDRNYEVWIYPDTEIGNVVSSHLVPTYFLVSADGKVQKKLVGFKAKELVNDEIDALLASTGPSTGKTEKS